MGANATMTHLPYLVAPLPAVLLAQAADPISGGAGWVGAGLLGSVLAWLLFIHLPRKDKQIDDLTEKFYARHAKKDEQIDKLIQDHLVIEREQRAEYKESLEILVAHQTRAIDGLAAALKEDLEETRSGMEDVRKAIQALVIQMRE